MPLVELIKKTKSNQVFFGLAVAGLGMFFQNKLNSIIGQDTYVLIYPLIFLTTTTIGIMPSFISIVACSILAYLGLILKNEDILRNLPFLVDLITFNITSGMISWLYYINNKNKINKEKQILEKTIAIKEEYFKSIFNSIPEIAWTAKPDGSINFYNKKWFDFTKSNLQNQTPTTWNQIIHPVDLARYIETWHHSLTNGVPFKIECRLNDQASNKYKWFLFQALPILNAEQKIHQWVGTCTDIDEQKKTQEQVVKTLKARDEFLSIASHELKTPLTSLKIQAQVFKKALEKTDHPVSKEKFNSFVIQVDRQISRLTRLIEDMLDISRIKTGKLVMNKAPSDLVVVVNNALSKMKDQFCSNGILIPKILGPSTIMGNWDAGRIEQVIINILTNAVKYGKRNPVEINIELERDFAQIAIKDYGIGIEPTHLHKIFDRFERNIDYSEVSGLGLGLFIAKQILIAHNGSIMVNSIINEGSTFFIKLPLTNNKQEDLSA